MEISMPTVRLEDLSDTVPEATYHVRVHKAEFVPFPKNKDANPYIRTQLSIQGDGELHLGRMIFANYPIQGSGCHRLRELLLVTGHPLDFELERPDQLIGLEFRAVVGVEGATGAYAAKNVVKKHLELL